MSEGNNKEVPVQMPSLKEMAVNLTENLKAVLSNAVTKGVVLTPEEEVKKRWDLCYDCEFLSKEPENGIIPFRCKKCGCGMKLKIRLAASWCPVNKWGKV